MSYVQRRRFLWMVFSCGIGGAGADRGVYKRDHSGAPAFSGPRATIDGNRQATLHRIGKPLGQGRTVDRNALRIDRSAQGIAARVVTVRTLGGHDRHLRPHVDGVPVFTTGEEVAEPLDGVVSPAQINPAITSLCRNSTTDAGWPLLQDCVVPVVNIIFTTRT
jgi:hypothetical protein